MKSNPESVLMLSPGLFLNCSHAAMKSHPESELLCASWALFELLTYSHEIPSRKWVARCLLGFIWIAHMQPWNSIQAVSCWVPSRLHLNCWYAAMKSHSESELLGASLAPFELLTCSHEISSRMWVAGCLLGSIWIAHMQPWNPIQDVSCWVPPWLHLNCWHAAMKSHSGCELLGVSLALFELLTCSHEIPYRMWVAGCLLGFIWIAHMHPVCELLCLLGSIWIAHMWPWNFIQFVSCLPPWLHLNCSNAAMKFHPECKLLCASFALFGLLTCSHEISSSLWVAVCLLGFIWIADMHPWNSFQVVSCCVSPWLHLNCSHAAMKSNSGCELLCTFLALFELLTCSHEIPSRMWVAVHLLGSIWIVYMQPWNPIQAVCCCVPPWLYLNCWHAAIKFHPGCELLYVFLALFELLTAVMKSHPESDLLCASLALFELLTCSHEILFRMWVAVCLGYTQIANMLPSHLVQFVPVFFHLLPSFYSVNRSIFFRCKMFRLLWTLASM